MKTVPMNEAQPLSDEAVVTLLKLTMAEKKSSATMQEVLDEMEKNNYFPYMIYKKRMDVMKLPLKMTPEAVLFMLLVVDRPGHVTCCMVDCMEYQEEKGKEQVTLEDMTTDMYPFGFYNEEAFARRIDAIKERKNKWDFIY